MIYLTRLIDCLDAAAAIQPTRVISILDPGKRFPQFPGIAATRHLRLHIAGRAWADQHFRRACLERILEFARDGVCEPLLVHCHAGSSRSGAAVISILADRHPSRIEDIVRLIAQKAPHVKPDLNMILAADDILNLQGQLVAAASGMRPTSPSMVGWLQLSLD